MDAVMAGDEEVETVARAFGYRPSKPHQTVARQEQWQRGLRLATDAIAALDRVRSRPAGGTEGECSTCGGRGWHTAGGNDPMACGRCSAGEAWESGMEGEDHEAAERGAAALCRFVFPGYAVDRLAMARAVLDAANDHDLDWMRRLPEKQIAVGEGPSPVSGTEPDRAFIVGAMREARAALAGTGGTAINARAVRLIDNALGRLSRPSVSGTEPDTAKLVEALREIAHYEHATAAGQDLVQYMVKVAREALAGFSVDAGKPEER